MGLCPICGKYLCDHTAAERGQTNEEMMRPLHPEEVDAWKTEPLDSQKKIEVARKHAHDPTDEPKGGRGAL